MLFYFIREEKRQRAVLRLVELPAAGRRPLLVLASPVWALARIGTFMRW